MADGSTGSTIKLSQRGIETSYLRYLADSAPGFLVLVFAYQRICAEAGGHGPIGKAVCVGGDKTPGALLVLALGFFLATPLGLLVNGVGWFALGWVQVYGARFWLRLRQCPWAKRLPSPTRAMYGDDVVEAVKAKDIADLYARSKRFEAAMHTRDAQAARPFAAAYGLALFVRSCTLLAFLAALYTSSWGFHPAWAPWPWLWSSAWSWTWIQVTLLLAVLLTLLEYYKCLEVLLAWYLLVCHRVPMPEGQVEQVRALIDALDRSHQAP